MTFFYGLSVCDKGRYTLTLTHTPRTHAFWGGGLLARLEQEGGLRNFLLLWCYYPCCCCCCCSLVVRPPSSIRHAFC